MTHIHVVSSMGRVLMENKGLGPNDVMFILVILILMILGSL